MKVVGRNVGGGIYLVYLLNYRMIIHFPKLVTNLNLQLNVEERKKKTSWANWSRILVEIVVQLKLKLKACLLSRNLNEVWCLVNREWKKSSLKLGI